VSVAFACAVERCSYYPRKSLIQVRHSPQVMQLAAECALRILVDSFPHAFAFMAERLRAGVCRIGFPSSVRFQHGPQFLQIAFPVHPQT
jgi:hypothetical protein